MPRFSTLLATTFALAAAAMAPLHADTRPAMSAIAVRDGAIKIDGKLDDWPAAARMAPYQASAADPSHMNPTYDPADRGVWLGPDDISYTVRAAHDSKYLYISGVVRDQMLINGSAADNPWTGDDFEIFIDANPLDKQYQAGTNENFAQFIFIPQHVNERDDHIYIWRADKYPGVIAASRLTPTGYTIEVAIPKDVVPNWKLNPDLPSIGFDVQIGDIDTYGVYGHDPGPKQQIFLLDSDAHFLSAAKLGTLQLDSNVTGSKAAPEKPDMSLPGYKKAQFLLDRFNDADVAADANTALATPDLARKAALYLFMRRPELDADVDKMAALLFTPNPTWKSVMLDCRPYAMMALAERHQLSAAHVLAAYGTSDDLSLRFTALYCVGVNSDKTVIPQLLQLLPAATNVHAQERIVVSLALLGDQTGVPYLKGYAWRDRGQVFGGYCLQLLKQLGIDYTPVAPQ